MNICAPFAGIVRYSVSPGQHVKAGETLAVIEAVKLEAPVYSPSPGTITNICQDQFGDVAGGDVLLELEENTWRSHE
ncbi:acetyl-CoA carboxylase biotin carboxyl carrier protein subunit [Corynebacterium sp. 3HC-13]|uniref:acetyl-CoA carboxylase biotin carboxyl carrier protein subunit n=1 Tax=Corynebacterium poyangense TaxID=2684405 RepID=UPI001CC93D7E|nr:acetyl-CoA carboxylase biotin carboxyl carrier protein subunit [Corynebacterium poyangense]MBZ8177167.1 acetyl-CoA carboxylase biotin carboxyl carrier protein subunit [Corynebacterium poyangense]